MSRELRGRARRLGDRVNTDYIISSSRKKETLDPHELKRWLLEAVDPAFARSVRENDMLVAGEAFGCGSAMEVAVTVAQAAGIRAVLARSFSRTYFRNAINNGLLSIECDTTGIAEGDQIAIRIDGDRVVVTDETTGAEVSGRPFPPLLMEIVEEGGLVPYLRARAGFVVGGEGNIEGGPPGDPGDHPLEGLAEHPLEGLGHADPGGTSLDAGKPGGEESP